MSSRGVLFAATGRLPRRITRTSEAKMTADVGFGAWVRARRGELEWTQKKLARRVGCSPVTVQKIEEGRRRPSVPLAEALAQQLDIGAGRLAEFMHLARLPPPVARTSAVGSPANPSAVARSSGLPSLLTPLLGRAPERATLLELLGQAPRRLLTLTGPPGVGKTRLALELAHDLLPAFDEVRFVPLAPLLDARQVWPEVARHFGLALGRVPPIGGLGARLGAGRTLLVLDNFEHLLGAAVGVPALLEHAPGLRILVTSREALRVTGEQVWPLSPLPLPKVDPQTPEALGRNPAVALFVERATAVWPGFALDAGSAAPVAGIVTWLGGLPLALELAAGRIGPLSTEEVLAELQASPLALLTGGARDLPDRQRSLEAAVAWTCERLSPELQRGFQSLGVCVGGLTLSAAEALGLCRADLDTLLAVGLLRRDTLGGRYLLLEPLRAFALARLVEGGEAQAAHETHARHFLGVREALAWDDLPWLEKEVGNLRAALAWAIEQSRAELAFRLVLALTWLWEARGLQREALDRYQKVLGLPGEVGPLLRLQTLYCGSTPAWQLGLFGQARAMLHQCLHLAREEVWPDREGSALMALGRVALEEGRAGDALAHLNAALPLIRGHGDAYNLVAVLTQLAEVTFVLGRLAESRTYAEQGMAVAVDSSGLFWHALLLSSLGELALHDGQVEAARTHLTQALELAAASAHGHVLTTVLARLACAYATPAAGETELRRAAHLWGAAQAWREANAQPVGVLDAQRLEQYMQAARSRLPEPVWFSAWEAGRQLDLTVAVRSAIRGPALSRAAR